MAEPVGGARLRVGLRVGGGAARRSGVARACVWGRPSGAGAWGRSRAEVRASSQGQHAAVRGRGSTGETKLGLGR